MTVWTISILALVPALALAGAVAWRGRIGQRLAAYQVASTVAVVILTLLTFSTDQAALTDLALTLVLLQFPGTLLLAVFVERWL